jgi:hypothetical protein
VAGGGNGCMVSPLASCGRFGVGEIEGMEELPFSS